AGGQSLIADLPYDASVVKSETRMRPGLRIFLNRLVVSQPYDQSAVTWSRFTMSVRPTPPKPYDANWGKSTTSKKFVTTSWEAADTNRHNHLEDSGVKSRAEV